AKGAKRPAPPPPPVVVERVVVRTVVVKIELVGTAEAFRRSVVAGEEPGKVKLLLAEEGDQVKRGQALVRLDDVELRQQIAGAKASLEETRTNLTLARREYHRQSALFRRKVAAQQDLDKARYAMVALQFRAKRLVAELKLLEDRLAKTVVPAPFDGVVVERHTQIGQWVAKGGQVMTLVQLDPIDVVVPVPEQYVDALRACPEVETFVALALGRAFPIISQNPKCPRVRVTFDGLKGRVFFGTIAAVVPAGDPNAHTFPVKVRVANPSLVIKSGMLARVTLAVGRPRRTVLAPIDAVYTTPNQRVVYAVLNGRAMPIPVETGPVHGRYVEVHGRLQPGMLVVVRGNERLFPGQAVRPVGPDFKPLTTKAGPKRP
ncbi:MAG: efflux RND transporter periplasmic adaptor subunit, partial [Proteobacteria bacterium]|nr:efflux RND transporter periplasmic adaptor subunit [Pseudomonadota bacterium]MBU1740462.1 efflux RND transporter periplasmic adaptor subunit [Pseudomonadota bacterium]